MIHTKAPERYDFDTNGHPQIFLAGSIEMGKAIQWQERLASELKDTNWFLYNPRRDDWDSSWVQDPTPGTQFHQQVSWELEHILKSDLVVFYFDPNTHSPITLLELGIVIGHGIPAIVCCPDGYFRKGNVVISCGLRNIPVVNSFEEFLKEIKDFFD